MSVKEMVAALAGLDLASVPQEEMWILLRALGATAEEVKTRLTLDDRAGRDSAVPEELLDAKEAARRLGVTTSWLYKHAKGLPFTVKLGERSLRFRASGMEAYLAKLKG